MNHKHKTVEPAGIPDEISLQSLTKRHIQVPTLNLYKSYIRIIYQVNSKLIQLLVMAKKTVRFNVMLTESLYQRLKSYAEAEEKDMAEVVRELIKTLPMKKSSTID